MIHDMYVGQYFHTVPLQGDSKISTLILPFYHLCIFSFLLKAQRGKKCEPSEEERIVQHSHSRGHTSVRVLGTLGPEQVAHTLIHHRVFTSSVNKRREIISQRQNTLYISPFLSSDDRSSSRMRFPHLRCPCRNAFNPHVLWLRLCLFNMLSLIIVCGTI